ncbi:MAG TPA: hypothetical protein VH724_03515 [Candidatus Angelobacter sp.]|nr:hypothetical protein [Candidatus Angelobacter sp.]
MNHITHITKLILAAAIALAITSTCHAQNKEKKITSHDLPAAVQKTVDEQAKGATIRGFSTEMEKGKRLYEAQLTVSGHSKDISMDANGNIVEIEEEVAIDGLPKNVKENLTKAAGAGTITKVESITKNGKLVAYEAAVKNGPKHSEIQVGPAGNKLAHPE